MMPIGVNFLLRSERNHIEKSPKSFQPLLRTGSPSCGRVESITPPSVCLSICPSVRLSVRGDLFHAGAQVGLILSGIGTMNAHWHQTQPAQKYSTFNPCCYSPKELFFDRISGPEEEIWNMSWSNPSSTKMHTEKDKGLKQWALSEHFPGFPGKILWKPTDKNWSLPLWFLFLGLYGEVPPAWKTADTGPAMWTPGPLTGSTKFISYFASKITNSDSDKFLQTSPSQVILDPILGSGKVPDKVFGHPCRSERESGKIVILFMKLN